MGWNGPERRRGQRRAAARQYGRRRRDVPVTEVRAAAARHLVEPGAPTEEVSARWRSFVQRSRPDLGGVDGAEFARRVADRDLLLEVARGGRAARRVTPPGSRLRRPDQTRVAGEPSSTRPKTSGLQPPPPHPPQVRRQPNPRVARVAANYRARTRLDPAVAGRVDVEL